jgi:hypothetical protein
MQQVSMFFFVGPYRNSAKRRPTECVRTIYLVRRDLSLRPRPPRERLCSSSSGVGWISSIYHCLPSPIVFFVSLDRWNKKEDRFVEMQCHRRSLCDKRRWRHKNRSLATQCRRMRTVSNLSKIFFAIMCLFRPLNVSRNKKNLKNLLLSCCLKSWKLGTI